MIRARLGITSAHHLATRLSRTAAANGLAPVALPCVEVSARPVNVLREARVKANDADWILITSARAIALLWPRGGMPAVSVLAVGPSTAEAAVRAGGSVAVVGEAGAGSLIEMVAGRVAGTSIFFPHASEADLTPVTSLEALGAEVTSVAVYETRSVAPGPEPVDAALFGSPSAVTGWGMSRSFDQVVLAAMGETTGNALAELGHPPDVVPSRPDFDLLIALVAHHLSGRSHL